MALSFQLGVYNCMGKRRKKRIKRQRRVLKPTRYFQCPRCNSMTLTIDFKKSERYGFKRAIIRCGTCGLYCEREVPEAVERVDVYNTVVDLAYEGRLEDECRGEVEAAEQAAGEAVGGEE